MNRHNLHPDTELLDQLRAGLLDDDPVEKAELEAHRADCKSCRQGYDWSGGLRPGALAVPDPSARLDQARRRALQSAGHGRRLRRLIPVAVAASVALVAVLLVKPALEPDAGNNQLARSENGEVPELYEELDFYLWLADHKGEKDSRT